MQHTEKHMQKVHLQQRSLQDIHYLSTDRMLDQIAYHF